MLTRFCCVKFMIIEKLKQVWIKLHYLPTDYKKLDCCTITQQHWNRLYLIYWHKYVIDKANIAIFSQLNSMKNVCWQDSILMFFANVTNSFQRGVLRLKKWSKKLFWYNRNRVGEIDRWEVIEEVMWP